MLPPRSVCKQEAAAPRRRLLAGRQLLPPEPRRQLRANSGRGGEARRPRGRSRSKGKKQKFALGQTHLYFFLRSAFNSISAAVLTARIQPICHSAGGGGERARAASGRGNKAKLPAPLHEHLIAHQASRWPPSAASCRGCLVPIPTNLSGHLVEEPDNEVHDNVRDTTLPAGATHSGLRSFQHSCPTGTKQTP